MSEDQKPPTYQIPKGHYRIIGSIAHSDGRVEQVDRPATPEESEKFDRGAITETLPDSADPNTKAQGRK